MIDEIKHLENIRRARPIHNNSYPSWRGGIESRRSKDGCYRRFDGFLVGDGSDPDFSDRTFNDGSGGDSGILRLHAAGGDSAQCDCIRVGICDHTGDGEERAGDEHTGDSAYFSVDLFSGGAVYRGAGLRFNEVKANDGR